MVEVYYHICKLLGRVQAEIRVASFLTNMPVKLVSLNKSLMFKAGELKCSHSNILSYNDCLIVAYDLNRKITLHTLEKIFKNSFLILKLKNISFSK
ncbi:MAG: PIN domain-containing protein [Promethearchaeati archaeon]